MNDGSFNDFDFVANEASSFVIARIISQNGSSSGKLLLGSRVSTDGIAPDMDPIRIDAAKRTRECQEPKLLLPKFMGRFSMARCGAGIQKISGTWQDRQPSHQLV
jgi:hypothetical protein